MDKRTSSPPIKNNEYLGLSLQVVATRTDFAKDMCKNSHGQM